MSDGQFVIRVVVFGLLVLLFFFVMEGTIHAVLDGAESAMMGR